MSRTPTKFAASSGAFAMQSAAAMLRFSSIRRAAADSHARLPVVDADRATLEATDFRAFRALAHLPLAMTAHVVFTHIDPLAPATTSATIVREVIRGTIGFDGLLMSDDISMGA